MNFILQAAAAVDTTAVESSGGFRMFDLLMKGGVVMIPLLILSVISIAYIIERYMYIQDRSKMDPNLVKNALDKIYLGQLDSAAPGKAVPPRQCERRRQLIARLADLPPLRSQRTALCTQASKFSTWRKSWQCSQW